MIRIISTIKDVLVEKHRTNKWLAEQLNVSASTVSRWCTNHIQPSWKYLKRIAIVLDVSFVDLVRIDTFDIEKDKNPNL